MNAPARITDIARVEMTDAGEVILPKVIRDRLGLKAGPVTVGINEHREAVVFSGPELDIETPEKRLARISAAIDDLRERHATGQSTDEYMREIRGDYEP